MTNMTLRRPLPSRYDLMPLDALWRDFFDFGDRTEAALAARNLPPVEISETDKEFLVALDLPGHDENDVQVRIAGDNLVISGERKQKKEEKDKHFHRVETYYGAFERRFELPDNVRKDGDNVRATFHKGVLEIRVPKVEPRPAAKIPIKSS